MDFRCPLCQSLIYSRKNKLCGVCGKPLPAELLFTDEQIAALKKESDQEEKRAKEFNPEIQHGHGTGGMGGML
jgi:predicted amidophosphoribosyltransferase